MAANPPEQNFPKELRELRQWCVWKYVLRGEKPSKVPFQPNGKPAESDNDKTWSTYDAVIAVREKWDGIGVFFAPPYAGVDLDDVVTKNEDGSLVIDPLANTIIKNFATYAEFSPSCFKEGEKKGGVKLWLKGKLPGPGRHLSRLEAYDSSRYFAVTGCRVPETPPIITKAQPCLTEFYSKMDELNAKLSNKAKLSVEAQPSTKISAESKFLQCYINDYKPFFSSDSEAIASVLAGLARKHRNNTALMVEDFERSPLFLNSHWSKDGKWQRLKDEELKKATALNAKVAPAEVDPDKWPELFHTYEQIANVPDPKWLIENFAEEFDKVMIGALSGHGKTLVLLSIVRSLCRCRDEDVKLFGYFRVPRFDHRCMYLIPEEGLAKFSRRLRTFGLLPFVKNKQLIVRTLSLGPNIKLTDPRILKAAEGRHVFLDTAIRFSEGDESSASDNQTGLAQSIFNLESVGAASVWGAHHSPKGFRNENYMELENVMRGSGDIGAMLSTAYAIRQLDDDRLRTWLHVRCIKPRDIDPPGDFQLEGKPWIDREQDFRMISNPGATGPLSDYLDKNKGGRPSSDEITKLKAALSVVMEEKTVREAGKLARVDHTTVSRWVSSYMREAKKAKMDVNEYLTMCLEQEKAINGDPQSVMFEKEKQS